MAKSIRVEIIGDSKSLEGALNRAAGATQGFGSNLGRALKKASVVAAGAGLAVTGFSVKMAADFQKSMSKIEGLVGVNQKQVQAWSKDLLELGPKVGKSPKELADALFFVTSAGLRGSKAIDVLTMSAKASAAGLGETKVIADAVTSAMNAYQKAGLTAGKATDILTAAVREGKLEAASLAPILGNLLPTASALNISFEDVAGTLAVLSRTGTDAAGGATQVQAVMTSMLDTSPKVTKALKAVGLTQEDLRKTASGPGGLVAVMRLLEDAFDGNTEAMRQVFPNVRAFRAVMNALAQDGQVVDAVLLGVAKSTGATEEAFRVATETFAFQKDRLVATAQVLAIQWGNILLPPLTEALQKFSKLVEQVRKADGLKAKVELVFTAAVGAVQAIAQGIADKVSAALAAVDWTAAGQSIVDGLRGALTRAQGLAESFMDALRQVNWERVGEVVGPGLATAFLTGLKTVMDPGFWARNWELMVAVAAVTIPGRIIKLGLVLGKAMFALARVAGDEFIRGIAMVAPRASETIGRVLPAISNVLRALPSTVAMYFRLTVRAVGQMVGEFAAAAGRLAAAIVTGVVRGLARLFPGVTASMQGAVQAVRSAIGAAFSAAFAVGRAIIDGIVAGAAGLAARLGSFLSSQVRGAISAVKGAFSIRSPSGVTADEIGKPLGEGVIRGWILGSSALPEKMKDSIKKAIEAARQAVDAARSRLSDAFGRMASDAISAFDGITGKVKTPAELLLAQIEDAEAQRDLERRWNEAWAKAQEAIASGDLGAQAEASEAIRQLEIEKLKAGLAKQAEAERLELDARNALRRRHFEDRLAALQTALAREGATHAEANKRIQALFKSFGIDYRRSGLALGQAFAQGLRQSVAAVTSAAQAIAKAAEANLKLRSPAKEGPLSDLDTWFKPFTSTLLSGVGTDTVGSALTAGMPTPAAGVGFGRPIELVVNLDKRVVARELFDPLRDENRNQSRIGRGL